ncbi:hypothetical protein DFH08DRAFT_970171 [Mycena albidolilacea]|uniref:Uncharacterized protein n=1 Tax=Mycena albidolilacea TaxID=1033008 RepID=A0AAD7EH63_9AGAR|nr:hypothetical protein DFH08DRAFT_970171 [Mycena albidolilacea]
MAAADEKPCTERHAGKYYDLHALAGILALEEESEAGATAAIGHELVLSACKSVSHETWAGSGASGCFRSSRPGTTRRGVGVWVFEWRTAVRAPAFLGDIDKTACPTSEGITFGGVVWFVNGVSSANINFIRVLSRIPLRIPFLLSPLRLHAFPSSSHLNIFIHSIPPALPLFLPSSLPRSPFALPPLYTSFPPTLPFLLPSECSSPPLHLFPSSLTFASAQSAR